MGGKQSIEAGSSSSVRPPLARDDRSPAARFGHLYTAYHSFSRSVPDVSEHDWLLHPDLNHLECEEKSELEKGSFWLFYRSAGDQLTPEHMEFHFWDSPCLGFARSFMEIAVETGIDPEVLHAVANVAAKAGYPMNIPSFVDACMAPGPNVDGSALGLAVDQVDSNLRAALESLKQCNDELDPEIALSFSHLDVIADYTKHIHACRRHVIDDRLFSARPTFSDVPEVAQYPHGDPVSIPTIYPPAPVLLEYLELGYGIERIAYMRLLTEICSHHIRQLSKSTELKHALIAAFAAAEICQAKLPFHAGRLPIGSMLGRLRSHAFLALLEMDEWRAAKDKGQMDLCEQRLNRCIRAIKHLIPVSPKEAQTCLLDVKEQIALHEATQDILNVEKNLAVIRLETSGMTPGKFAIVPERGATTQYQTETDGPTAIELAGARARNPHLDIQHALDVLHFVAREAVRENATSALRAELIEAIQDIAHDLESSDLPIHQQRAGEIERFLDARPFNAG